MNINTSYTIQKNNLIWILDWNMRGATVKHLEGSLGENLYDNGLDSGFLNKNTSQETKT